MFLYDQNSNFEMFFTSTFLTAFTFVAHSCEFSLGETLLSTLCTDPWLGRSVKIEKSFSQNASIQITKSFPLRVFLGF